MENYTVNVFIWYDKKIIINLLNIHKMEFLMKSIFDLDLSFSIGACV